MKRGEGWGENKRESKLKEGGEAGGCRSKVCTSDSVRDFLVGKYLQSIYDSFLISTF